MAFLLFAIAASAIGIVIVLMRNRRPSTMEHSIEEFEREELRPSFKVGFSLEDLMQEMVRADAAWGLHGAD